MTQNINFSQASFILSSAKPQDWVADSGSEVAFAGRSNVGKSSAINLITNQRALARTSKTPGRTQHIVFFALQENVRLVDLPGYGYAKTPLAMRMQWQKMVETYLSGRRSLKGLVLPMDIRRPFTELDQLMMEWTATLDFPVHILLTKADKLSRGKAQAVLLDVQNNYLNEFNASAQLFSAPKRIGIEPARKQIARWLAAE